MGLKPKNRNTFFLVNVLAIIIGALAGFVAALFKWLIVIITTLFTLIPQTIGPWGWVIAPALGGLIVAVIVNKGASEAKGLLKLRGMGYLRSLMHILGKVEKFVSEFQLLRYLHQRCALGQEAHLGVRGR